MKNTIHIGVAYNQNSLCIAYHKLKFQCIPFQCDIVSNYKLLWLRTALSSIFTSQSSMLNPYPALSPSQNRQTGQADENGPKRLNVN